MKNHYKFEPQIKSVTLALMLAYLVLVWVCKDSAKPETLTPQTEYAHFKSREASRRLNGVKNLPVPVLADSVRPAEMVGGEARESTSHIPKRVCQTPNSRGGQFISYPIVEINGKKRP